MSPTDDRQPGAYPANQLANIMAAARHPQLLDQIGPYHIEALIGEGGMGSVYRAEQHEPIRRTVAIKVVKLGMDTRQVIARFDAERQALALMDHPNVARVIDAGATETGRPYFVMEFVDGEPITTFADREKLTLRDRLELFMQACDAVQHAHQKAIIHRDLKPSNILVMRQGDRPVVKVIDFGVAKAISQRLTEKSLFTEAGQLMGTPEYMAPEQADGNVIDVDTRTDVYALGVILYELLIGALPFESSALRSAAYNEIQRIIREVDPPRPSTRLSKLGGDVALAIAQLRQVDLELLHQQLKRELEWIPLKAMRKAPEERYFSPRELAEDIDNYLAQRPLRAGPESRAYRTRKFLRRNKLGVVAAAAMLLLLVSGIAATSWQAIRATRAEGRASRERDNAGAMFDFLVDDVLAGATPENIPDAKVRDQIVRAMISPAASRVGDKFKDQPLTEASVRETIRSVLVKIGRLDLALPHAQRALAIRREQLGPDDPDSLTSLNNLASVLEKSGMASEAEPLYKETLDRRRILLGDDHAKTLLSMNNYAHVLWSLGRFAQAEPFYKEALERRRRVLGDDDIDTVMSLNNYASVVESMGNPEDAEPLYRQALEKYRQLLSDDHPQTMTAMSNYGSVLARLRRYDEAAAVHKQVLDRRRRVLGDDHPDTIWSIDQYSVSLMGRDRLSEAEPLIKESLQRRRARLGDENPQTFLSLNNMAVLLYRSGRYTEAEAVARDVHEKSERNASLGPTHSWTRDFASTHANCLDSLDRHAEANALRQRYGLPRPATGSAIGPSTRPSTAPASRPGN